MKVDAVIVAGGSGHRAGLFPPKQYQTIGNQCVLAITINRFIAHTEINSCVVVIAQEHRRLFDELIAPNLDGQIEITYGGSSRTESVFAGLEALAQTGTSHVLIHDAARPFLSSHMISNLISAMEHTEAAVPAIRLSDALWTSEDEQLKENLSRDYKLLVQTPQTFKFEAIHQAYLNRTGDTPDCAAIAIQAGMSIKIVEGERMNLKITTPEDLNFARSHLSHFIDVRTGQGVDVHVLGPGEKIVLCGVEIPFHQSLIGHSDADVGLHAIVDAIYGALGIGDIGTWFPPEDMQWKDADSSLFVEHARRQLSEQSYQLTSIDCTFVCEQPKIRPHQGTMQKRVAALLNIPIERVNIKATTSEKLGFMGRKEGIMALATATIVKI